MTDTKDKLDELAKTCVRCGHPSDWHRLDDSLNLDPTDPATPFRCLGYDPTIDYAKHTGCECPDFLYD